MTVQRNVLNSIKQTRHVELTLEHPGIIWPVMSFTADVVAWGTSTSLPLAHEAVRTVCNVSRNPVEPH